MRVVKVEYMAYLWRHPLSWDDLADHICHRTTIPAWGGVDCGVTCPLGGKAGSTPVHVIGAVRMHQV